MISKRDDRGSVTVFLCLVSGIVLILIVSLVSVMRFRWEKTQIVRSGNIATQAEFSKYYRPLYDDYRMFYYIETDAALLQTGINSYFIKNQSNMPKLLALTLSNTDITDKKYATDDGAYNVRKQMTEAVKYSLGEKAFDETAGKILDNEKSVAIDDNMLKEAEKEIDKVKEESKLEAKVLELLKAVEGVSVSGGNIKCAKHFVKEGIPGEIKPLSAGVDSDIIWNKTKDNYWSLLELPGKLKKVAEQGYSGSRVAFPVREIRDWRESLSEIRKMTVDAHNIAMEINEHISQYNGKMICDTVSFERYLSDNIHILDKAMELADMAKPSCKDEWKSYMRKVEDVLRYFSEYNVRELRFDYATLNIKKQTDPRKGVGHKASGILNLLLEDNQTISTKAVSESDIYYRLMGEKAGANTEVKTDSARAKEKNGKDYEREGAYMFDDNADGLAKFVGECRSSGLTGSGNNALDVVGTNMYITMFLGCFLSDESDGQDKRALDYEREYIIAGKESDEENMRKVVGKILMLRTGASMIHILSDSEKRSKAYAAAASIVGFTGMDAIVRIVQYSIIAAWAYEDACIDVAALLAGKKIPYTKSKSTMNINFAEMPLFGRELIHNKVKEADYANGMDYCNYLDMLLLSKAMELKSCRVMDIIQYNIKRNYSRRFSFQDALYAATVHISCSEPFESSVNVSYSYE